MLEQEIAAIDYLICSVVPVKSYFGAMPEDVQFPCVFYPFPEFTGEGFSLSTYVADFALYVKFMDRDTAAAYQMAAKVLQKIMAGQNKIPLVDEQGKVTGKCFRIGYLDLKQIEEGVYQLKLSWKRYTPYQKQVAEQAKEIFFNGKPISR